MKTNIWCSAFSLSLVLVLLSGCGDSTPVVVVSVTVENEVASVKLEAEDRVEQQVGTITETIDGRRFIGLKAEGDGQVIRVLAARIPNEQRVRVITDSTLPLMVHGRMVAPDGMLRKASLSVDKGTHDVILDFDPRK